MFLTRARDDIIEPSAGLEKWPNQILWGRVTSRCDKLGRNMAAVMQMEAPRRNEAGYTRPAEGLSEHLRKNAIDPATAITYDLLPGEAIVATYDVHIPGMMLQRWVFYMLCIFTCGLFLIYYYCVRWCIAHKFCVPPLIIMNRGKMVLTSFNRLLVWKTHVVQQKTGSCACALRAPLRCARPSSLSRARASSSSHAY